MLFENSNIEVSDLPQSESIPFQQLAPAYPKVAYIGNFLFFTVLAIAMVVAFYWYKLPWEWNWYCLVPIIWLLWFLLATYLVSKNYEIQGYALREKDILYRNGIIWRRTTAVPFNRIQHCEVKQGPVERLFNLKTLEVYTAGGQSSDLKIPGLQGDLATQLKEFILKRTAADEPK